MIKFAERLRFLRKERGIERKELANTVGLTVRAYQYYEEGKREPNLENLVALAKYFQVSTDYLLGVTDTP